MAKSTTKGPVSKFGKNYHHGCVFADETACVNHKPHKPQTKLAVTKLIIKCYASLQTWSSILVSKDTVYTRTFNTNKLGQ